MKSKVYFTKQLDSEATIKLYEAVGLKLTGYVAFKIHSGEKGNQNFLKPQFWKPLADHIGVDTVVECNTAYPGARNETEKHKKLMEEHASFGCKNIGLGALPLAEMQEDNAVKELIDRLNTAGGLFKKNGFSLYYHNHNFEFAKNSDGETWFDYILQNAPKGAGVVCFSEYAPRFTGFVVQPLGSQNDKLSQAQHVFAALRRWSGKVDTIFAEGVDEGDQGLAYMNRLLRASGFTVLKE